MPRVLPRQPRFKDADLCRAWQAFTYDDETGGHTVRRGARLLGSHDAVRRYPWNFVLDSQPDDAEPSPHALVADTESPPYTKPTKLRVKCRVLVRAQRLRRRSDSRLPARDGIVVGKRGSRRRSVSAATEKRWRRICRKCGELDADTSTAVCARCVRETEAVALLNSALAEGRVQRLNDGTYVVRDSAPRGRRRQSCKPIPRTPVLGQRAKVEYLAFS